MDSTPIPGTTLSVRPRGRAPARVVGNRLVLEGEQPWIVEGPRTDVDRAAEALNGLCERLSDRLLEVRFGNAVGLFPVIDDVRVEVVSGKWDESHFNALLADLTAKASALPFTAETAGALPFERSLVAREDVLYHAFVYLRHIMEGQGPSQSRLLAALELILRDPHRQWRRTERRVPIELARRVDPAAIVRLVASGEPMAPVASTALPLARMLGGHLPIRVDESYVDSTVDTPENRFVKAFLQLAARIVNRVDDLAASQLPSPMTGMPNAFTRRLRHDCAQMSLQLDRVRRHPLWGEVGDMVHMPVASTILQGRRGYREILTHFVRLRLATRLPLNAEAQHALLEIKDIALLYELWCFFAVVDGVTQAIGPPTMARSIADTDGWELRVKHDMEVAWPDGTRVFYNPRFSRSRGGLRHSYSVPLRPDIALVVPRGRSQELHLLDAKFRLDRLSSLMPLDQDADYEDATQAGEPRGTFKRVDLYKMHAYRDAICDARTVWILYPGNEMRFFAADGAAASGSDVLDHVGLDGVGAIPLRPGPDGGLELAGMLAGLLGR